jgi:hypothetical protein
MSVVTAEALNQRSNDDEKLFHSLASINIQTNSKLKPIQSS